MEGEDNLPPKTVFLIGNGTSRKGFLLSKLRSKGVMIGCNLAYRDYPDFDAIVSLDIKPGKYIEKEFHGLHFFNNSFKDPFLYCKTLAYILEVLPVYRDKLDSGKVAAYVAKKYFKADRLIMIGMDFGGPDMYSEVPFEVRPNYVADWNDILAGYKEVIRVGPKLEVCEPLNLKQIDYAELEEYI